MIEKTKNLPGSEAVPVDGGGLAIDKKDVGTGNFIKAEPTCIGISEICRTKVRSKSIVTSRPTRESEKLTKIIFLRSAYRIMS